MEFRTKVTIEPSSWKIGPCEEIFCVGSCFADNISRRFTEEKFRVVANPYGVMYNPVSVWHSVERYFMEHEAYRPSICIITLGTNHVYRLKETNEIVDNCQKRPQNLFEEQVMDVKTCRDYLQKAINFIHEHSEETHVLITVSPIRYAKYGFHGSMLSKSTLMLASNELQRCDYFPAYEIVNDELRDYRFYKEDMLHPSDQAVDYIWERLVESYFSQSAITFMNEWKPIKQALSHHPFNPESEEYRMFMEKTKLKIEVLSKKYPNFAL